VAKPQKQFECQSCGTNYPRWQGKCESCNEWNTLLEIQSVNSSLSRSKAPSLPVKLTEIKSDKISFFSTNIPEVDNILGKGLVRGAVTLLGGEPGIGKSTLSLQIALECARKGLTVLYVSGEESPSQIQLRSKRLGPQPESLFILSEVDITNILSTLDRLSPDLVILDSIQVVYHPDVSTLGGTVSQVRQCANCFIDWIKDKQKMGILIGHITKEGNLAGPKVLEHMVDVILYLEGERSHHFRILRCYKNRYATTSEIGVFEMKQEGLVEVHHHSELFLSDLSQENPGSIVSATTEGNRIFLVEVQALVVASGYGIAKRNFVGVDTHRANLVIATLEKMVGIKLSQRDVFLNIIGGLKVAEPAIDLAIVLSIISSVDDRIPSKKIAAIGEVGLTGEVRPVPGIEKRLNELKKMGFNCCYVPEKTTVKLSGSGSLELVFVKHISDAIRHFMSHNHPSKDKLVLSKS
jgi:DNA repair protein RadA/Sms